MAGCFLLVCACLCASQHNHRALSVQLLQRLQAPIVPFILLSRNFQRTDVRYEKHKVVSGLLPCERELTFFFIRIFYNDNNFIIVYVINILLSTSSVSVSIYVHTG